MKVTAAVAALLGITAVAAVPMGVEVSGPQLVPRKMRAAERMARRRDVRKSRTMEPSFEGEGLNTSHVQYSSNWGGAVLVGSGYKSVTATITVPTPSEPSGGSSRTEYAASAWVGIDGDTCTSAILQTGVDFYAEGSQIAFDAWYEWYPAYAYDFSGITVAAGNQIKMTVTATSSSAGTATLENLSTGQTVSHSFSGEGSHLCQTNAEWIVEDFDSNGGQVAFADFGSVTFSGASATTSSGSTEGPSSGTILDIRQNGQVLTSCSAGSSSVTCSYS